MPEPIIAPMTIMVASSVPSSRTRPASAGRVSAVSVVIGSGIAGWLHGRVGGIAARSTSPRTVYGISWLDEGLDVGDRLIHAIAPPVDQCRIQGSGQLVDQEGGRLLRRAAFRPDLGEIAVMNGRGR